MIEVTKETSLGYLKLSRQLKATYLERAKAEVAFHSFLGDDNKAIQWSVEVEVYTRNVALLDYAIGALEGIGMLP